MTFVGIKSTKKFSGSTETAIRVNYLLSPVLGYVETLHLALSPDLSNLSSCQQTQRSASLLAYPDTHNPW